MSILFSENKKNRDYKYLVISYANTENKQQRINNICLVKYFTNKKKKIKYIFNPQNKNISNFVFILIKNFIEFGP
jgi:hypothetical protein